MKVLVDTNVIIDALMRSRPSSDGANGVKDFTKGDIPVIIPDDFLELLT